MLGYAFSILWEFFRFCRGGSTPRRTPDASASDQEIRCFQALAGTCHQKQEVPGRRRPLSRNTSAEERRCQRLLDGAVEPRRLSAPAVVQYRSRRALLDRSV